MMEYMSEVASKTGANEQLSVEEKLVIRGVQKRHRRAKSFVENHVIHRNERREKSRERKRERERERERERVDDDLLQNIGTCISRRMVLHGERFFIKR